MSSKTNRLWSIALPLSVVFLAGVYYIKVPEFRKAIDSKTPVVHNLLGRWVQEPVPKVVVLQGEQDPMFAKATPPRGAAPVKPLATPVPMVAKVPPPATPAPPSPPSVNPPPPLIAVADLQTIASDR